MIKDSLKATGKLVLSLYDKNNNIKKVVEVPNLVVTTGLNFIASRMVGTTSAVMSHMAVGTDNTTANTSQISLQAEVSREALAGALATGSTITYNATFGPGSGTGTLVEAGVFNNPSAGVMLCRTVFPAIVKEADDILTINWLVTIS